MSNGCPKNVTVAPGAAGAAPAIWGNQITLETTDVLGFGVQSVSSKVTLKCSDGRTLVDALQIKSWTPQAILCTLPAKNPAVACDPPNSYQLWISLSPLNTCGPYQIAIIGVIDPTQPGTIDPADLTELAKQFAIYVPPASNVKAGEPIRVQLVPPPATGLIFTGIYGTPLPLPALKVPSGSTRSQSLHTAPTAKHRQTPPVGVRSEATHTAPTRNFPATKPALSRPAPSGSRTSGAISRTGSVPKAGSAPKTGGVPKTGGIPKTGGVPKTGASAGTAGVLPVTTPSITVEVNWSVTANPFFGPPSAVNEGTLFTLTNPDDPGGMIPTLTSLVLGVLFQPWITAMTAPPTLPRVVTTYTINARIRLSAGNTVIGDWVNLSVPLPVPRLEIPVILLLFRDVTFTGDVLPCVPANSPFATVKPLRSALNDVQKILGPLQSLASVAAWMTGLEKLRGHLPDDTMTLAVADKDGKINLDNHGLDRSPIGLFGGGSDWEDQVSSIILFGPPAGATMNSGQGPIGSSVHFFSAPGWNDSEGQYNIDIGKELSVTVQTLVSKNPASDPPGALKVVKSTTDDNFNDVLSTLKFL